MTSAYKKRALAGWNRDKRQSNRNERLRDEAEIEEQQADESRIGAGRPKRLKMSTKEKLIKREISELRWALKRSKGNLESLNLHGTDWLDKYSQRQYQLAKRAIERLSNVVDDAELQPKIRRQIVEILEGLK